MKVFAVHYANGVISHYLRCNEKDVDIQVPPEGGGMVEIDAMPDDWPSHAKQNRVEGGQLLPRQPIASNISKTEFRADGRDEVKIVGIPAGATVKIFGSVRSGPHEVFDGEIVLTSTTRGRIFVEITHEPEYQDFKGIFHAT